MSYQSSTPRCSIAHQLPDNEPGRAAGVGSVLGPLTFTQETRRCRPAPCFSLKQTAVTATRGVNHQMEDIFISLFHSSPTLCCFVIQIHNTSFLKKITETIGFLKMKDCSYCLPLLRLPLVSSLIEHFKIFKFTSAFILLWLHIT